MAFVALGRLAYTAHTRTTYEHYPIAANAEIPKDGKLTEDTLVPQLQKQMSLDSASSIGSDPFASQIDFEKSSMTSVSSTSSDELLEKAEEDEANAKEAARKIITTASRPVAILPQWLAPEATSITMRENSFPHLGQSFSVTNAAGQEILQVKRERPSLSERQFIIDANTEEQIMCVRQDLVKLPRSYRFDDPSDKQVLDLQGNFFNPVKGPKATALFTNAIDGGAVALKLQGAVRNRRATVKNADTGEVLASMKSSIGDVRSLAGRRTYEIEISAGVDVVLVIGLIAALDARA